MPLVTRSVEIAAPPSRGRVSRFFQRSNTVAPNMVGMARKKENSAATRRSTPSIMAPMMVAPARETPGIMARHWTKPMPSAVA